MNLFLKHPVFLLGPPTYAIYLTLQVWTSAVIDEPIITADIKIADMKCIVLEAPAECRTTAVTLHVSSRAEQTGNNSLCMPQHTVASSALLLPPNYVLRKNCKLVSVSFEVMLPSACNFIVDGLTFSCRCYTLHVSAYMAIFKCVMFYFYIPEFQLFCS
jgi:hypothetical protein